MEFRRGFPSSPEGPWHKQAAGDLLGAGHRVSENRKISGRTVLNISSHIGFKMCKIQFLFYKDALDCLGAFMILFKDDHDFLVVGQYLVAQILALSGKFENALAIYRELTLCPFNIEINFGDEDHISAVSLHMAEPILQIELALLVMKMGDKRQAGLLLSESFTRCKKYKYKGWNGELFEDIMSSPSFEQWFSDPTTFEKLAELFRRNHNSFMAAESLSVAAARLALLPPAAMNEAYRDHLMDVYLRCAEALAELCSYAQAEGPAHKAYALGPHDMIVIDRAAKCCRRHLKENDAIFRAAKRIRRACRRVHKVLKAKILAKRKLIAKRQAGAATRIASFLRMVLTRNRTAGDRLSECPIRRINKLVASLRRFMLKSGREQVAMWCELWDTSATRIQTALRRWITRRNYSRFRRGLTVMKKVFRGQMARKNLRESVRSLQERLNAGMTEQQQIELFNEMLTSKWEFVVDLFSVVRLCSGNTCVSQEGFLPGTLSMEDPASPLRPASRVERRAIVRDGLSLLRAKEPRRTAPVMLQSPGPSPEAPRVQQKRTKKKISAAASRDELTLHYGSLGSSSSAAVDLQLPAINTASSSVETKGERLVSSVSLPALRPAGGAKKESPIDETIRGEGSTATRYSTFEGECL
jgi:hypothetical protein